MVDTNWDPDEWRELWHVKRPSKMKLAYYKTRVNQRKADREANKQLAVLLYESQKYEEANNLLLHCYEKLDIKDGDIVIRIARSCLILWKRTGTISFLRSACTFYHEAIHNIEYLSDPPILLELASTHMYLHEYNEAISLLTALVMGFRSSSSTAAVSSATYASFAAYLMAQIFFLYGKYEQCEEVYSELLLQPLETQIPTKRHIIPIFPVSISTYCVQLELALVHQKMGREELFIATLNELYKRLYNSSHEFKQKYPRFALWKNDYKVWHQFAKGYGKDHNLVFISEVLGMAIERFPSPQ